MAWHWKPAIVASRNVGCFLRPRTYFIAKACFLPRTSLSIISWPNYEKKIENFGQNHGFKSPMEQSELIPTSPFPIALTIFQSSQIWSMFPEELLDCKTVFLFRSRTGAWVVKRLRKVWREYENGEWKWGFSFLAWLAHDFEERKRRQQQQNRLFCGLGKISSVCSRCYCDLWGRCQSDMGIPIPKTLVIWASGPVTLITKVIWEGNTHITRVLGMGMPKTRGCLYHCNRGKLEPSN